MRLPLLTRRGDTLFYDRERGVVQILDRRRYPQETVFVACQTVADVAVAIRNMVVQGGPPIAYVAGYGMALAARQHGSQPLASQRAMLTEAAHLLRTTRPTADDLHHLLEKVLRRAEVVFSEGGNAEQVIADLVDAEVARGDAVAEACGRHAASLLPAEATILTHCFAGAAFNWMLFTAVHEGKSLHLYANETRPYLQGARLTAHQAHEIGVRVTLLTDAMAGLGFCRQMFHTYITAADRIALDGSIANKIGTYQYAVLAARHQVPFYVLGYDGPDPTTPDGSAIPIEERDPDEVLHCAGVRVAPDGIEAWYPAFDITPPDLITYIVTERGIFTPADMANYHRSTS